VTVSSDTTARARASVARKTPEAQGLGAALADLIDDPGSFVAVLDDGFRRLADEDYAAEQDRVAPGSGQVIGVRWPLVRTVARQLRGPLRESSSSSAISLAQHLVGSEIREIRLFAHEPLSRSLADDPERTWQVIRRLARRATDWISTDSLAPLVADGILREPFRWAELEQLVYSSRPFERRLVGATLATLPFRVPRAARASLPSDRGSALIRLLIGDADVWVQKALGWALRSWSQVDPAGVTRLLMEEADRAARTDDGHRAWVVRDALPGQPQRVAAELRRVLAGVRRRADAPSTSEAAAVAAEFAGALDMADRAVALQGDRMGAAP
jgi:3-methyladenine DNA glycosylase AlkD